MSQVAISTNGRSPKGKSSPGESGRWDTGFLLYKFRGKLSRLITGGCRGPEVICGFDYLLVPENVQCVLALEDTGAKLTLIYGNPDHFTSPTMCVEVGRGHCIAI